MRGMFRLLFIYDAYMNNSHENNPYRRSSSSDGNGVARSGNHARGAHARHAANPSTPSATPRQQRARGAGSVPDLPSIEVPGTGRGNASRPGASNPYAARRTQQPSHVRGVSGNAAAPGNAPRQAPRPPMGGQVRSAQPANSLGLSRESSFFADDGQGPSWTSGFGPASGRGNAAFAGGQNAQDFSRARYGHQMAASRDRGRKRLWSIVLAIASTVLLVCLVALGIIAYGYWHGTKVYDDIANTAFTAKEADALSSMTVDWDALLAQNPDTVAWVYMPGTSIDYPIVQGENDEEYLQKDFTGDSGGLVHKGSIFLSADNASDFSDSNNFIYGHNMNDDTMFAHILQMTNQEQFDAARTFYVLTPEKNYRCSTFAIDVVESTETELLQATFTDAEAMLNYINERMTASVVTVPSDIDSSSLGKIFSLITCGDDYATTRAVLFGGVVEEAVPANASSGVAVADASAPSGSSEGAANAEGGDSAEDAQAA